MYWRWSFLVFVISYTFFAIDCSLLPTDISRGEKPRWTKISRMQRQLPAEPAGNTVRFRCAAEGSPIPSMLWFKDGHIIKKDSRISGFKYKSNGQIIILESVVPADVGIYMCKASNKYGSINHTYQLDVQERAASRPILKYGFPTNKTVFIGVDVEFKCIVYSDPHPHVKWVRHIQSNDSLVDSGTNTPHVIILKAADLNIADKDMEVLHLKNVSFQDAGEYTCLAGNSIGISHQSAWLTVLPGLVPETKPRWKGHIRKEIYFESFGSSVEFKCPVRGIPTPRIQWFKNDLIIQSDSRSNGFKLKKNGQLIVLKYLIPADEGTYTCKASNTQGSISRTLRLRLIRHNMDTPSVRPFLKRGILNSKRVYIGSDVKFKCFVVNDPNPNLKWVRRVQPIGNVNPDEDNSYDLFLKDGVDTTKEEMEVLYLENVSYEDSGEYSCVFENFFGVLRQSAWLIVLPAPVTAASSLSIVNN